VGRPESVELICTQSNLKEVTLSIVPTVVERSGGLNLARGPRIISLVLEAFNCMSLLSVHLSKLMKKFTYQSQMILVGGL